MQSASQRAFSWLNKACLLCQQNSRDLVCEYCMESIHFFDMQQCTTNLMQIPTIQTGLSDCQFDKLIAIGEYCWPLSNLLSALKYNNRLLCAKAIAQLFTRYALAPDYVLPDCIVPVPLGAKRYAQRKYNQAAEIAKFIGNSLAVPVQSDTLVRCIDTLPQTELSAAQRKRNLKNAFELRKPLHAKRVAILDDVVTTGATTQNIYSLLKKRYPSLQIEVWSACVTRPR